MKKTALILAFIVCFLSCQSYEVQGSFYKKVEKKGKNPVAEKDSEIDDETKRLSKGIDNLYTEVDRLKKVNNDGSGIGDKQPSQSVSDKIPVTPKIVEFILKNYGRSSELKFYLSRAFTLKETTQKENTDIEIIDNNKIRLNKINPANEQPIEFTKDSEGILAGLPGSDGMEIKIFFKEQDKQDKILVFRRNGQQNRYELFSVIKDNRSHPMSFSEPVQLYLFGVDDRDPEVKVVSADFEYYDNQPYQIFNAGSFNDDFTMSAASSRNVMGSGSVSPARVKRYVETKKNLTNRDSAIIDKYFEEARFEGVNVDIAIAQMLHWTNNLRNSERVNSCNYGGLSAIDNVFNGRFPRKLGDGMTEGVRAHIQHLKGYASTSMNRQLIVDPRYNVLINKKYLGTVRTFDQLYRKWSVNSRYGQYIDGILRDLYRF
jgi:hypothetical protein